MSSFGGGCGNQTSPGVAGELAAFRARTIASRLQIFARGIHDIGAALHFRQQDIIGCAEAKATAISSAKTRVERIAAFLSKSSQRWRVPSQ